MVDKNLLEIKKRLQKTRNILSKLNSIKVLHIYEELDDPKLKCIMERLQNHEFEDYFSYSKIPDSKISMDSEDNDIYNWIIEVMRLRLNQKTFLLCNGIWIIIEIIDVDKAARELWNYIDEYSEGFTILNENMDKLLEVGNDSRDEDNFLFDEYDLKFLKGKK